MPQGPPPRLHVLLREESPTALVIRQGPTRTFCTIAWDLAKNTFEVGQWVKHKLYPERGDISPDGKWHVYFALNGRWKSETKGSWTGLARVPYLKCVHMWPLGNTWGGGGMIVDAPHAVGRDPTPPLPMQFRFIGGTRGERLRRDGWSSSTHTYEKRFGGWCLSKTAPGSGFVEQHRLIDPDGASWSRLEWQWADLDLRRKRLVFAEAGCIYSVPLEKPLAEPNLLFDANDMTFEAIAAPYETASVR